MADWTAGQYRVTDDPAAVDLDYIAGLLAGSYWADDRPRSVIDASWRSPACIPLTALCDGRPVGFARLITDRATFTWLGDVMVDPAHRGRGVGKLLVLAATEHPATAGIRMVLGTRDAHGLYEQFGFVRKELMLRKPGAPAGPVRPA